MVGLAYILLSITLCIIGVYIGKSCRQLLQAEFFLNFQSLDG